MANYLPLVFKNAQIKMGKVIALANIDLTISEGPLTVLIGPNGAGKTTLLKAAMGLIRPSLGTITWNGENRSPSKNCAILFQHSALLRRSARNNVRYALAVAGVEFRKRHDRADELLLLVGLEGLAERPARRLSGGEQRRLALAMTLARAPILLFLDEPCANIDPAAAKLIETIVLDAAARGVKIVMSTHDMSQAKRLAGDVIFMNRGYLVEHAPASQFFIGPHTKEAGAFLAGELLV
jgi:tungstate transport system ATP-binding protein